MKTIFRRLAAVLTVTRVSVLVAVGGMILFSNVANAATYNFNQASWVGGATANTAVHPTNLTGWNQYGSATTTTAAVDLRLPPTNYAFTDGGATSSTPVAPSTGGGFANGTKVNTTVTGVGGSATVGLTSAYTPINVWDTQLQGLPLDTLAGGSRMIRNGTDDDIYVTQGCGSGPCTGFYKYSVSRNAWTILASTPGLTLDGTSVLRNGADDFIYVAQGFSNPVFWKYSISSNTWTTLAAAPGNIDRGSKMIRNGSEDFIYVTQGALGASATGFYRYSISGNTWTSLAPFPVAFGSGSEMLRAGTSDDIYVTQGSSGSGFYKYSITANSWTALASSPVAAGSNDSKILRNGTDNDIYFFPTGGTTTALYKYSISANAWTALAAASAGYSGPGFTASRDGAGDYIYVSLGNSKPGFYRYSISGNSWTTLATSNTANQFFGNGSSMIRASGDDYIYLTQGNRSTGFFRYSVSTNSWASSVVSNLSNSVQTGDGTYALRAGAEDNIYLTRGAITNEFYKFSISSNTWTTLAPVPSQVWGGSRMIRNTAEDYIYLTQGYHYSTNPVGAFYRYSVSTNTWTTLAPVPADVYFGSTMLRNGLDDTIYLLPAASTALFYKYSISTNTWTPLTVAPGSIYDGSTAIRNGADDAIYVTQGGGATGFYKYSIAGNSWTTLTAAPGALGTGSSMLRNAAEDAIYVTNGGGNSQTGVFYKYSIAGNSWTTLATPPGATSAGTTMVRNGSDDTIYVKQGNIWTSGGTNNAPTGMWKYSIAANTWTSLQLLWETILTGSTMLRNGADDVIYVTRGSTGSSFYKFILNANVFATPGTFTSAVIDTGSPAGFTTMSYVKTTPTGTGITMDVRAGNTAIPDGTWTTWTTGVASGGSIATLAGNRYFQYRANLTTTNSLLTPTLGNVTINYSQYPLTATLVSSKYDSGAVTNIISKMSWTATGTSTTETVKFQVRSSPDGTTWSNWCGPSTACAGTDYFQDANNGVSLVAGHPLNTGGNDRYFQYQAFLSSSGGGTPVVTSATVQYVVNATPDFNAAYGTNGVTVSQISNSTDPNWGKVSIGYSVRDTDTSTGSVTPGFVTPSFEYSTNSGVSWIAIPASDLLTSDITNKAVNGVTYTIYGATWSATSTIPSLYNTTMEVRVTVNDNEGANNIAKAASGLFTLDTKAPAIPAGGATLDSSVASTTGSLILTATDDSQLQYRYCNDNTFPASDTKGNSCAWSALGGNIASSLITWTPNAAITTPATETVYLQVRDALGNVTSQTIVAPAIPTDFDYKDISNIGIGVYREFLSWALFQNSTGSTFGGYNLYSSTDGTNYSLLSNITNLQTNFYVDNITTATSSMHYYKVGAYDTNGNKSHFTQVLSDIPNGTGGTDVTPPTITNVAIPAGNIKNTSAQITFTTDKLTQATVQYRVNGTTPWSTYSNISYLKDQSVYITGLIPNTLYNVQVKAVDVYGNQSATTAAPDFTTSGGPVITNVTVSSLTDISATIFWNTSTSSDSYVYYSQYATMVSPGTAGSAALVSCVASLCQHNVTISGLTAGKQYYYYVKSTDGLGNTSTDTNTNNYYSFVTTLDTTPPVISGISTPVMAAKQAVVVWKTDEPSTSQVLYGTASGDTSKYTITDTTKSIYHVVTLSLQTTNAGVAGGTNELTPETKYYYVVKSADTAGNTSTSPEQTFTTPNTGDVTIVAVSIVNTSLTGAGAPDTTPPIISDIKATPIDSFNEAISFTTNKDVVTFIDYGKDTQYGNNVGHPVLTTSHNTKLPGLAMGTNYHYRVTVIDKSGNMTKSDDQTFKTPFLSEQVSTSTVPLDDNTLLQTKIEDLVQSALPSLSAPYITVPKITNISEHGATVTWNTNVKAYGLLGYANDDDYIAKNSSYSAELSAGSDRQTTHSVNLTNLKSNTKYHIQASGYVFQQVVGKSDDITFLTKPAQIQGSVAERTKNSFTIVWTTDEPATSIIEYKDTVTGAAGRTSDETMSTAHSVKVENLPSGVTYTVNISGINKTGNTLEAITPLTVTTSRDVIPPVISGFKVDNALVPGRTDRIQTIVSWKTDEPGDSIVYYEEGAGTPGDTNELANKVSQTGTFIQNHSVILPNLKPGTIYRLKISSADDSGNRASFGPRTVITPQQTQSITDVIFKNFEDSFKFLRAF